MATFITTSGSPYNVPGLDRVALSTILLEKVTTNLPTGVTKSGGNPATWIQFAPPVTGTDLVNDPTWRVNPNNVELVL